MSNKRHVGSKKKIGDVYYYPQGKYVRQKLASSRGCVDYRIKKVPKRFGRKLLICITPQGKTKAVALLRHKFTKKAKRLKRRVKR